MNGEIVTVLRGLPPLESRWIVLSLVVLTAIAWWFYRTEAGGDANRTLRWSGATLRTAVYCLLAVAWGGWSWWTRPTEKPEFVIAVDISRSQLQPPNVSGLGAAAQALAAHSAAIDALERRFRLRYYTVGADARLWDSTERPVLSTSDDATSALGDALVGIADQQRGRPTAGAVLITDGAVTAGRSLASAAEELRRRDLPLYVAGSGAAASPPDVAIVDVQVDEQVFVNDLLQFDVTLRLRGLTSPITVRLSDVDHPSLAEAQVTPDPERETVSIALRHRPRDAGELTFRIEATTSQPEVDAENNRAERTVRVSPADFQVLLVAGQPSYEFRRLKTLLDREFAAEIGGETSPRPVLKTVLQDADPEYADFDRTALGAFPLRREELFAYDVVILLDVQPQAIGGGFALLRDFVEEKSGGLAIIAGPRSNVELWKSLPKELLPAELTTPQPEDDADTEYVFQRTPLGRTARPLLLADQAAESDEAWRRMPPFLFRTPVPAVHPGVRVLAEFHTSGRPPSPALTLHFAGAGRVLFQASDESYRFAYRAGDVYFGRYWQQWIRYLARGKLRGGEIALSADRREYAVGEPVRLRLRMNELRLVASGEDVRLRVSRADGFARTATAVADTFGRGDYAAEARDLSPGQYTARLEVPAIDPPPAVTFEILDSTGEHPGGVVQANELQRAAELTGGRYRGAGELTQLLAEIPTAAPAPSGSGTERPLWNSPLVAAVLIGLLCGEWYLRKRAGLF